MAQQITADLRVARVLQQWPETYDVFCRYGCPDMRRGFFRFMAGLMKLRWAARVHRIPLAELVAALNQCVDDRERLRRENATEPACPLSLSPRRPRR